MASKKEKILIFEPWGLGDAAIALLLAKALNEQGYCIDLMCAERWRGWIETKTYVNTTVSFNAPWTQKNHKYAVSRYLGNLIIRAKQDIQALKPDIIIDVRGDIRHFLFLKLITKKKIISLINKKDIYAYDKPRYILNSIGINADHLSCFNNNAEVAIKSIFCNFSASDYNRAVPIRKRHEIIEVLLRNNLSINLLADESNKKHWDDNYKSEARINIIAGTVVEIVNSIKGSDLCISTDTGWIHVAYLEGKRTIGLYGFDTIEKWSPPGCLAILSNKSLKGRLRYKRKYRGVQPLEDINVDEIYAAIDMFVK